MLATGARHQCQDRQPGSPAARRRPRRTAHVGQTQPPGLGATRGATAGCPCLRCAREARSGSGSLSQSPRASDDRSGATFGSQGPRSERTSSRTPRRGHPDPLCPPKPAGAASRRRSASAIPSRAPGWSPGPPTWAARRCDRSSAARPTRWPPLRPRSAPRPMTSGAGSWSHRSRRCRQRGPRSPDHPPCHRRGTPGAAPARSRAYRAQGSCGS